MADFVELVSSFTAYCEHAGLRKSAVLSALSQVLRPDLLSTEKPCVAVATPPQEGKTTAVVHWLAWLLIRDPRLSLIYVSYNLTRAQEVSRQVRSLVSRETPLDPASSAVSRWHTAAGGGLLAAGRGTAVTGFTAHLVVIDDPMKDMQEAQSSRIREALRDHFDSVLWTRLASSAAVVLVATRWHKDDLTAHLADKYGADVVRIPAQSVGDGDILGRPEGAWLESVQGRSAEEWERTKASVSAYTWSALYQGSPTPVGGGLLPVDQVIVVPDDELVTTRGEARLVPADCRLIQSWDLAFTGDGDYVSGQVWAYRAGTWTMVDHVWSRLTFTETVQAIVDTTRRWPQTAKVYVEKAANGHAVIDRLKRYAGLVAPVTPVGSKESRAVAASELMATGRVRVAESQWSSRLKDEWHAFPKAAHDDAVDAMTQALLHGSPRAETTIWR